MQCKTERATRVCDQCTYDSRRNLPWGGGKSHLCFVCFAVRDGRRRKTGNRAQFRLWDGTPPCILLFVARKPWKRLNLNRSGDILLSRVVHHVLRFYSSLFPLLSRPAPARFSGRRLFRLQFSPLKLVPFQTFPQERHADTPELINHTFTAIETAGSGELICSLCDRPASRRSG